MEFLTVLLPLAYLGLGSVSFGYFWVTNGIKDPADRFFAAIPMAVVWPVVWLVLLGRAIAKED